MRTTRPIEMFSLRVIFSRSSSSASSSAALSPSGRQPGRAIDHQGHELVGLGHEVGLGAQLDDGGDRPSERPMATAPSDASRSARLAWLARPCSRSQVMAWSMSPSFSSRARLASSMPTPVRWRRALDVFGGEGRHGQASSAAAAVVGVSGCRGVRAPQCPVAPRCPSASHRVRRRAAVLGAGQRLAGAVSAALAVARGAVVVGCRGGRAAVGRLPGRTRGWRRRSLGGGRGGGAGGVAPGRRVGAAGRAAQAGRPAGPAAAGR